MLKTIKSGVSRINAFQLAAVATVSSALLPMAVQAQTTMPTIDTSEVTGFFSGEVIPSIGEIGIVALLVIAAIAGFKWLRGPAS